MTLKKPVVNGIKNKELDGILKIIDIIILVPFLLLELSLWVLAYGT